MKIWCPMSFSQHIQTDSIENFVWQFPKSCVANRTNFEMVHCNVLWLLLKYPWSNNNKKYNVFHPFYNSFPYRIYAIVSYSTRGELSVGRTKLPKTQPRREAKNVLRRNGVLFSFVAVSYFLNGHILHLSYTLQYMRGINIKIKYKCAHKTCRCYWLPYSYTQHSCCLVFAMVKTERERETTK